MIVLDTHVLVWWIGNSDRLSSRAKASINQERKSGGRIVVSAISAWEIAMLVSKGRLTLAMDVDSWLQIASQIEHVRFVPLDTRVLVESTRLPGEFHKDPADRMVVAQARTLAAPLVTADEKIQAYRQVKTIW